MQTPKLLLDNEGQAGWFRVLKGGKLVLSDLTFQGGFTHAALFQFTGSRGNFISVVFKNMASSYGGVFSFKYAQKSNIDGLPAWSDIGTNCVTDDAHGSCKYPDGTGNLEGLKPEDYADKPPFYDGKMSTGNSFESCTFIGNKGILHKDAPKSIQVGVSNDVSVLSVGMFDGKNYDRYHGKEFPGPTIATIINSEVLFSNSLFKDNTGEYITFFFFFHFKNLPFSIIIFSCFFFLFFFIFFLPSNIQTGTNLFRTGNAAKPKTKWWGKGPANAGQSGSGNWPRSRPPTPAELPLYEQGTKLKVLNSIFQNNKPTEMDTNFNYKEIVEVADPNSNTFSLTTSLDWLNEYHLNWFDETTSKVSKDTGVIAGITQTLKDGANPLISIGMSVTGPGIAVGSKVTALGGGGNVNQITLSLAATATAGEQTLTFSTVAPYQTLTGYPSILRIHDGWDDTESTVLLTNKVTTNANELVFAAAHGLAPGTAVVYNDNSETPITGLTDGTTYYVLASASVCGTLKDEVCTSTMKLEASLGSGAITIAAGAKNNKVTLLDDVAEYKDWVIKIAATTITAAIGDAVFQGADDSGNSETLRLGTLTKKLTGADMTVLYVSNQEIKSNSVNFVTDKAIKIGSVTIPANDITEATQPNLAAPLYNVLQSTEWVDGIPGWTQGNSYYIPMDVSFIESTFKNNEMPLFEIKDKQLKEMGPSQRIKLIDLLEGQNIMGADLDQLEDHAKSTTPNGVPPTPTVPLGKKMKASLF